MTMREPAKRLVFHNVRYSASSYGLYFSHSLFRDAPRRDPAMAFLAKDSNDMVDFRQEHRISGVVIRTRSERALVG